MRWNQYALIIKARNRILTMLLLAGCSTCAAGQHTAVKVTGHRLNHFLLVVPVTVNGQGPFQFIVDTGSSITVLDTKLFDRLGLTAVGLQPLLGFLPQSKQTRATVRELSVAGFRSLNLPVISMSLESLAVKGRVDGILGENFLDSFDMSLDYRGNTMWLDSGTELRDSLGGVRVPLTVVSHIDREIFHHRPIVTLTIPSYNKSPVSMVLDSGAQTLTLFPETMGHGASRFPDVAQAEHIDVVGGTLACSSWSGDVQWETLALGSTDVVVCSRAGRRLDTEGNLPTSVFHSVFIAHLRGFVIFNPDRLDVSESAVATASFETTSGTGR